MVSWDERTFARCQDVYVCVLVVFVVLMPVLTVHCSILISMI